LVFCMLFKLATEQHLLLVHVFISHTGTLFYSVFSLKALSNMLFICNLPNTIPLHISNRVRKICYMN
ncbi:unnamed protein product, partial [Lampetra planeri]